MGKRHQQDETIGKLHEAEIVLAQGGDGRCMSSDCGYGADLSSLAKEYGGLKSDQARRMKILVKENLWLMRASALLRDAGWTVNHKRVERIWPQEGLKVPQKKPKRGPRQSRSAGAGGSITIPLSP